ncbi:hypothetical protein C5S29_01650, partial [ANME-1 cluster archaeon GoMg3.2]|nr:hypothetical protein [ANME-1 cluster archaeon GoMg3.2]
PVSGEKKLIKFGFPFFLLPILASKILVTPKPVTSPVPIGCSKEAHTKLCAAKCLNIAIARSLALRV